jgi:hypothetical protein
VNPIYNLLTLYRDIFKYGRETTIEVLGPQQYKVAAVAYDCGISYDCLLIFAAQAVLSFLIGYAVFVSAKGRFADEV